MATAIKQDLAGETARMNEVLAAQKAVLLGRFTGHQPVRGYDRGFGMDTVADWLRAQIKAPVLGGLPFGHVPTKVVLPVGHRGELAVQGRDALLFWG